MNVVSAFVALLLTIVPLKLKLFKKVILFLQCFNRLVTQDSKSACPQSLFKSELNWLATLHQRVLCTSSIVYLPFADKSWAWSFYCFKAKSQMWSLFLEPWLWVPSSDDFCEFWFRIHFLVAAKESKVHFCGLFFDSWSLWDSQE
jgi:hypothetical protein